MSHVERMRQFISASGISHRELAERVGLTRATMSRIVNGKQELKLREAYEITRELGVTLNDLVDEEAPLGPPSGHLTRISHEDLCLLSVARALGFKTAMARLVNAPLTRPLPSDLPPMIAP